MTGETDRLHAMSRTARTRFAMPTQREIGMVLLLPRWRLVSALSPVRTIHAYTLLPYRQTIAIEIVTATAIETETTEMGAVHLHLTPMAITITTATTGVHSHPTIAIHTPSVHLIHNPPLLMVDEAISLTRLAVVPRLATCRLIRLTMMLDVSVSPSP